MARSYFLLFCLGFPVPLMYRWKHSGEALDYCKEGLLFHQVLPRTLEHMAASQTAPHSMEKLFEEAGLLEEADDCEQSFAALNAKRKQLVFEAFKQPTFLEQIYICESLVRPNIDAMNQLFARSSQVASLYHLPRTSQAERARAAEQLPGSETHVFFLFLSRQL
jgi:hypothetical protein